MPLSIVNGISLGDINTDLGFDYTNQLDLNNSQVRKLLNNAVSDVSMNVANGRSLTTAIGYMIASDPTSGTVYNTRIHDAVINTTTNIMYMLIVAENNTSGAFIIYVVAVNSNQSSVIWSRTWAASNYILATGANYQRHKMFLSGSYLYVSSYGIPNDGDGSYQNLISKLNISDGSSVWNQGLVDTSTYIGSPQVHGLKVDASGNNVYIAGEYKKNLDAVGETNQTISFVGNLYASNGNIQWMHKFGAASNTGTTHVPWCQFYTVAVDSSNVYVAGQTSALTITAGSAPTYYYGIVAKYNSAGTLQWTKTFRDSGTLTNFSSYTVFNSCTDSSGNLYLLHDRSPASGNSSFLITSWNAAGTSRWVSPELTVDVPSGTNAFLGTDNSNNGMQIGPDGNLWFPAYYRPSSSAYDGAVVISLNASNGALVNARRLANNVTSGSQEFNEGRCIPLVFDKDGFMRMPGSVWGGASQSRGHGTLIYRANTSTPTTLIGPDKSNVNIKFTATSPLSYFAYANVQLNAVTSFYTTTTNAADGALADPTFLTLRDPNANNSYGWQATGASFTGYLSRTV